MKNKFTLLIIAMALMFGCAKEEKQMPLEPSEFINEYEGYFVKDLLVYDENNVNSAYFRVFSKDENVLDQYLSNHEFSIGIVSSEYEKRIGGGFIEIDLADEQKLEFNQGRHSDILDDTKAIHIELITENFTDNTSYFYLNTIEKGKQTMPPNQVKTGFYGTGFFWVEGSTNQNYHYYNVYTTNKSNGFVGLISFQDTPTTRPYAVKIYRNCFLGFCNLRYYDSSMGGSLYRPFMEGVGFVWNNYTYSRIGFAVTYSMASPYSRADTYRPVYSRWDFRGRTCSIGAYDGRNCYIATSPSGSVAWVDHNLNGLYHSPWWYSNMPCPIPGSHFDGVNCRVATIPYGTTGFVIDSRHMYVRPDLLTP